MFAVKLNNRLTVCGFTRRMYSMYKDEDLRKKWEAELEKEKEKLEWRKPFYEHEGFWKSKFSLFTSEKSNADIISALQQPINLSPNTIKKYFEKRRIDKTKAMQQFMPERHRILGNDLAAAHFVVHRGGAVR